MPILNPPTSPPNTEAGDSLYKVGKEWCIGDTVRVFNNNFVNIDTRIDGLSSNLYSSLSAYVKSFNITDSTTLDLTYSTTLNRLSGNIIDGSINTVKLGGDILQSGKALLTAASLSALRDTRITNLADNHVLTWSSTSGVWINLPSQGGGAGGVTIGDKGDITVSEFNNQQSWTIDNNTINTDKLQNLAVTPEKLFTGGPRWNTAGNVGIAGAANSSVTLTVYGNISASGTVFGNIGTISSAAKSMDIIGGTAGTKGQLLCQVGLDDTDFTTVGSNGQILQSVGGTGDGKPIWVNQSSLSVKDALSAGYTSRLNVIDTGIIPTINRLIYQRRFNETVFIPTGSIGQILTLVDDPDSNQGPTLLFPKPAWSNRSDITVGSSTVASNLTSNNATYGSIPYQTSTGTTAFTQSGAVSGQLLRYNGNSTPPSWVNQSSIVAGLANAIKSSVVNGILFQSGTDVTEPVTPLTPVLNTTSPYIFTHIGGSGSAASDKPSWKAASSLTVGNATAAVSATIATNLRIIPSLYTGGPYAAGQKQGGIVYHYYENSQQGIFTTEVAPFPGANENGKILTVGTNPLNNRQEPTWVSPQQLPTIGSCTTARNLSSGVQFQIPYQTGSGTTSFIDAPASNQLKYVLGYVGTNPTTGGNTTGFAWLSSSGSGGSISSDTNLIVRSVAAGSITNTDIGTIKAQNDIVAFASDKRLKENITPILSALQKVDSISGFTYTFNDLAASYGFNKNIKYPGVFAQDIQQVLPEAVRPAPFDPGTGENYLTVQYEKIVPLLIEAIKELSREVKELKSKLT